MNTRPVREARYPNPQRPKAVVLLGALLALQLATGLTLARAQAAAGAEVSAQGNDQAMEEYERNHWRAAFSRFAQLADQGDADAARMALRMRRFGSRLFGMPFDVTVARLRQWGTVVAQDDHANCVETTAETASLARR